MENLGHDFRVIGPAKEGLVGFRRHKGSFLDPILLPDRRKRLFRHRNGFFRKFRNIHRYHGIADRCDLLRNRTIEKFQNLHIRHFGLYRGFGVTHILPDAAHEEHCQERGNRNYHNAQNNKENQHAFSRFLLRLQRLLPGAFRFPDL